MDSTLEMVEQKKLFFYEEKVEKKQIMLCHTSRKCNQYLQSLKSRLNGKYKKIPAFIITENGKLIKNFNPEYYSDFFGQKNIDRTSIFIMLENLGWVQKNPLNNKYMNWVGNIYNGEVYEKKWRGRSFWSTYGDKQIEVCGRLISELCNKFNINKDLIGHSVKVDDVNKFNGITSKGNYNEYWTDLSPAFDYEKLKNNIK